MRWNFVVTLSCECKRRLFNVRYDSAADRGDVTTCDQHGAVTVARRQGVST